MLKALELVGFKSFADKTRLEFPPGITVVVGPNGSGKSNIVDAIKWVLGEQSVKSLRGKEMADVIFNGSSSRRALNAAETTLTFDNTQRKLAVDTPEVHVTRRVYRSGEGEYLINRQPCRLRDIRDLFAGTGAATEAYSVIEQGKVDVLLQSSPRDRRLIFEEAAGISRFKAKKLDAIRRLERVEQNLLRLSDIVDEVDNRLRGVRLQASKARKYKEYSDRLQALRTQVAAADWRTLSTKLAALEAELHAAQEEHQQLTAQADALEEQSAALENEITASENATRASESRIAQVRERIAVHEAAIDHERRRMSDLEEEIIRYRRQLTTMSSRAIDLQQQLRSVAESLVTAETEHRDVSRRLAEEERGLTKITAQVDEQRAENERRRASHLAQMRAAAGLSSQASALESKVAGTQASRERGTRRLQELTASVEEHAAEQARRGQAAAALAAQHDERQAALAATQASANDRRTQAAAARKELSHLQKRHGALVERADVLDELERRHEGVSAGVKQVLADAEGATAGPLSLVRGLVADLLHVDYESAPLVEVALGELAICAVVAEGDPWIAHLRESPQPAGRVGLVRLDLPEPAAPSSGDLSGLPGVLGRADTFVETSPSFAALARRLLGRTWFVETLDHALALAAGVGRGLSFVTRSGELLAADGTLFVGPRHASTGLISRRSELRELRRQIDEMTAQVDAQESRLAGLDQETAQLEAQAKTLAAECRALGEELGQERMLERAAAERHGQLRKQHTSVSAELTSAEAEHERAAQSLVETRDKLNQAEATVAELEAAIQTGAAEANELEQTRSRFSREAATTKIEVVKCEQRVTHLRSQQRQLQLDQQERDRALADGQSHLEVCRERLADAERNILNAESALAELYLQKEAFAAEAVRHVATRDARREQRSQLAADATRIRARLRKLETKLHAKDLAAGEVRHERTTLADRLREDYAIELADLEHELSAEELQEREVVEREISDLRNKVNSIGGVNLDALAELEELETRYNTLSSQFQDLTSAKNSLESIIGKINADSRRLFADTLEVVRDHFQSLFRKLFGGGHADIVLEEGVDILDSGIEIIARPPGKEPRNISLLSGGEKTMTCVALLLAIFRSRPSPFCVLDEVDAALDEANIERFIGVLQEFLAWTQFIVVTHSKKTMTCANTLYGVTMQESGVSKRVSVRFEDVSETGEILNVRDSDDSPAGDETQAA